MVGSSAKTSSRRVQEEVAASMEVVGDVTVSPEDVSASEKVRVSAETLVDKESG